MKKSFFIFFVCCILFFTLFHQVNAAPNDPVTIPDAELRAVIEAKLGKNSGDTITESDMLTISGTGIAGQITRNGFGQTKITDLTGLEYAENITSIVFHHEHITDLSPLAGLTKLTELRLQRDVWETADNDTDDQGPSITDISDLANLTALKTLGLSEQSITDLESLRNLTALTHLDLGASAETGNRSLSNLEPLKGLTALTILNLGYNQITDVSHLGSLTALTQLILVVNRGLQDISPLKTLTSLQSLQLNGTRITHESLSAVLPTLSNLTNLNLLGTPISNLSVLDSLPAGAALRVLDLRFLTHSGATGAQRGWLLTDITPLIGLQQAGKVTTIIDLNWNWNLDYDSLYTDIPVLITAGITDTRYSNPTFAFEGESAENHVGRPGTRHTFVARASKSFFGGSWVNRKFRGVPVTWRVTAPDSTQTVSKAVTGNDGLTRVSVTLGSHGDVHTVEAVVPATTHTNGPTHPELRVSFTATADREAPIPAGLHVTFEDYPETPPTDEFNLTIIFSEPVTGFEKEDITVETELETGAAPSFEEGDVPIETGFSIATLKALTAGDGTVLIPAGGAEEIADAEKKVRAQTYTATIELPAEATGTVQLIVHAGTALSSTSGQVGPAIDTPSEPIEFGRQSVYVFPSHVAMDKVIFNEFRNAEDDKNDWIELKNISDEDVPLGEWEVSIVESEGEHRNTDREIVAFPDYTLPAGGILLIVNTDPSENDLLRGRNIEHPKHHPDLRPQYLIAPEIKLPDSPYLLILRSVRDKNGKPEAFEDLAGDYHRDDVNYFTNVWPLQHTPVYTGTGARLSEGEVWQRGLTQRFFTHKGARNVPKARGYLHEAWALSAYQGGLGYDPNASPETSLGTPGYSEVVITDEAGSGQISFSEVMFATDEVGSPAQWIELYNNSATEIVDLEGWQLVIEARHSPPAIGIPYRTRYTKLTFKPLEIMSNQTVLLVTRNDRNSKNIPTRRIYDVFQQHSEAVPPKWAKRKLLGSGGFALRLLSPDGTLVDIAGNLDGKPSRDTPQWALPESWTETGARSSLIRVYEDRVPALGTVPGGWVRAADTDLLIGYTYWGHPRDDGTPGYRQGSPLPVTLSSFSADRQDGSVVVKWTTASEMENAGFYVLRSREKSSGFERVSPSLIVGAGTTAEQNTYTYQDTTAEANVPYYYRLEEVSLSGDRRAVATARLRGHLSAANKLLWKWADVKIAD